MNIWEKLKLELNYYGINILSHIMCAVEKENGRSKKQGIIRTLRQIRRTITWQRRILYSIWDDLYTLLQEENITNTSEIINEDMKNIFIFSIKDLYRYLLCFEDCDNTKFYYQIRKSLNRDIKSFTKNQIYLILEYKLSIDWVTRNISRLLHIQKLLSLASIGKERLLNKEIEFSKTAAGISGPWANLDLPMEERVYPWDYDYGDEQEKRELAKQKQTRYTKGFNSYNKEGVGEGHYWTELRNEPFSWANRDFDDPYPSRHSLSRFY